MLGASVAIARCAALPSARVVRDAHRPLLGCREHNPCLMRSTITTHLLVIANRLVSRSLLAWVCWCSEGEEVCEGKMFRPVFPDCRARDAKATQPPADPRGSCTGGCALVWRIRGRSCAGAAWWLV